MFKQVILEDWASMIPIISFVCMFGVFVGATILTLLKSKNRVDQLSQLPLDDEFNEEKK